MAAAVDVSERSHAMLAELAVEQRRPMSEILADLVEQERRRKLFDRVDAAYARLPADPKDYQAELRALEGSLMDGLEDDPWAESFGCRVAATSGKRSSTRSAVADRPAGGRLLSSPPIVSISVGVSWPTSCPSRGRIEAFPGTLRSPPPWRSQGAVVHLCDQLRIVAFERLLRWRDCIDAKSMAEIEDYLRVLLGP